MQLAPEGAASPFKRRGPALVQLQLLVESFVDPNAASYWTGRSGDARGGGGGAAVRAIVRTARVGSPRPTVQQTAAMERLKALHARKVLRMLPSLSPDGLVLCDGRNTADPEVLLATAAFSRALGLSCESAVLRCGLVSLIRAAATNVGGSAKGGAEREPDVATRLASAVRDRTSILE